MIILGINDNHDASAALVVGDKLVAAAGQERFDRHKNSGAFPWDAIFAVLHAGGVGVRDIDRIAVGSQFTPAAALRRLPGLHASQRAGSSQYSPLLNAYIAYQVGIKESGAWAFEVELSRKILTERLRARGIHAPLHFVDHHRSHAWSAYRSQRHHDALVLTLDAMGDGTSVTVSEGQGGDLKLIYRQSGFSAINTYYSRITEYLGFKANRHEGKITGLAAQAPPPDALVRHFAQQLHFGRGGGFNLTNYLRPQRKDDAWHQFLTRYRREEIAAALQKNLEDQVVAFVRHWVSRTGRRSVTVAGGTFANVKLNQRIHELPEVKELFVYPNMGDGGLAAGAALGISAVPPRAVDHVYLGPDFSDGDFSRPLSSSGLSWERPSSMAEAGADLLAAGKVVARCSGRMEWGPRALGNRSVLYRPDDPSVNDWLNKKLDRTEFMPFAPLTLWKERKRFYQGVEKAEHAARFMTVCFDVTDEMRRLSPGVVHGDGTARPQLLRRKDNPACYDLVSAYGKRTGNPTVINTSFNMHEEPIVRSPREAVRAFQRSQLDALILGPFLARGPWMSE